MYNAVCCDCQTMIENGAMFIIFFAETSMTCEGSGHVAQFVEGVELEDDILDSVTDDWF